MFNTTWPKSLKALVFAFIAFYLIREICTYYEMIPVKYFFTPLITATVLWMAILSLTVKGTSAYRILVTAGLVTALIADTMLMIVGVNLLQYGLIFFIATHIFYCFAFSRGYRFSKYQLLIALFLVAYIIFIFSLIHGKTEGKDALVLIYMIIISSMTFLAFSRLAVARTPQRILLVFGAVLFMASDTVLAINAFLLPIPHSTVYTWLTYGPAQAMIALSCHE